MGWFPSFLESNITKVQFQSSEAVFAKQHFFRQIASVDTCSGSLPVAPLVMAGLISTVVSSKISDGQAEVSELVSGAQVAVRSSSINPWFQSMGPAMTASNTVPPEMEEQKAARLFCLSNVNHFRSKSITDHISQAARRHRTLHSTSSSE